MSMVLGSSLGFLTILLLGLAASWANLLLLSCQKHFLHLLPGSPLASVVVEGVLVGSEDAFVASEGSVEKLVSLRLVGLDDGGGISEGPSEEVFGFDRRHEASVPWDVSFGVGLGLEE